MCLCRRGLKPTPTKNPNPRGAVAKRTKWVKSVFFFRFWVNFSIFFVKIAKIVHSLQISTTHFNGFEGLGMGFNPCRFSLFRFSIFFVKIAKIVHSLQIFTTHFNGFEGLGMGFNPCRFSLFRFSIFFRQNSKKLSILYRYLQPILCA
jgi:hypothetical protein